MTTCTSAEPRRVKACRAVRRMRGGSQADLILTDDGWFVCKWRENPQHRRVLINEALAGQLLHGMVATPEWALVRVDEEFLEANPDVMIRLRDTTRPVLPGWHFGSRLQGTAHGRGRFDFLPHALLPRVRNVEDFLRVLVFDLWVDNSDGRQAVFTTAGAGGFRASMIDHGFAFGFDGKDWQMRDRVVGKGFPGLEAVYLDEDSDLCLEETTARIQEIAKTGLDGALRAIPVEWIGKDDHLEDLLEDLSRRARRLPGLVEDAKELLSARVTKRVVGPALNTAFPAATCLPGY